ncbi:PH domain-containing protein [Solihabitans fulvus]|uniref:PH domain-containing protein n=2 Tax=Solihabitans fulvus TaxID=1892852 RepID=A0A5B2WS63_9PSEU|nr:PH domain-containing protein [Solihabitans fulvus]
MCATPIAFAKPGLQVIYLVPLAIGVWVVRNRTVVDRERLVARTTFGGRDLPWAEVAAVKVGAKSWAVAVLDDETEVPLPAVRARHLSLLAAMSGGRMGDPSAAE